MRTKTGAIIALVLALWVGWQVASDIVTLANRPELFETWVNLAK